jgi:hypothetical protein
VVVWVAVVVAVAVAVEDVAGTGAPIIQVPLHPHLLMRRKIRGQLLGRELATMTWIWLLKWVY